MIKLQNVTKRYVTKKKSFTSVDDVTLTINKGEVVGIVGASGAGKSTVLRLINGLITPTSGEVIVNNKRLSKITHNELNKLRPEVGTIFQAYTLLAALTVAQNIALLLKVANYPKSQIATRVKEVLELVNLSDKKDEYPRTLSGGEKQRVAIARAISNDPKILLCDEITSALDQKTTAEIIEVLRKVQKQENLTIVFVSHELEVVAELCDRVVVLDDGKVTEDKKTRDLFLNPATKATKELVNTVLNFARFEQKLNYLFVYQENVLNEPLLSKAIKTFKIEPSILYAKSIGI